MAYTVNMLATMSGVSVRTLHYYDELGLLKPAYYGENGYRYYEQEQLLLLQQILFYRELGFPLNEVQQILTKTDFDRITALESHKQRLNQDLERASRLIKTINKTIAYLKGETNMNDNEIYYGFDSERQNQYEKELVAKGIVQPAEMDGYKKMSADDKEKFLTEMKAINKDMITAIDKELAPSSKEVQAIIRRHHSWVGWNPSREKYIALSEMYQTPEFKNTYDTLHPKLLNFVVDAMKIFANKELN